MINYNEKLQPVKAFVFDFDGVMTDGSVWVYADKETVRCGNIKDGFAVQYAVKKGYIIAVISGATSMSIDNRMAMLGVGVELQRAVSGCNHKARGWAIQQHQHVAPFFGLKADGRPVG